MADSSYIIVDVSNQQQRPVKLHDNGDGSYSITTFEMGSGGGSSPSSSIGGGNSVYSNVQGDFTATANAAAKTITLSAYASAVLSAVLANINFLNAVIKRRSSAGVVDTLPLTSVSFAANVLTLSDMAANFAVGDTVAVYVTGPDKGFDKGNDLQKVIHGALDAGEDLFADVRRVEQRSSPLVLSASSIIKSGAGRLFGIFVSAASSTPTIKLWDNTSAAGSVLIDTFTPAPATFYPMPGGEFSVGLFLTISGTVACTVFSK